MDRTRACLFHGHTSANEFVDLAATLEASKVKSGDVIVLGVRHRPKQSTLVHTDRVTAVDCTRTYQLRLASRELVSCCE